MITFAIKYSLLMNNNIMMTKGKELKPHIGIFGRRNNGKSSLINALAQQDIAIVSEEMGTTTDPVKKSMEIPGVGPVVWIDTAGIDDIGSLGEKRVEKTLQVLKWVDAALLVIVNNQFDVVEEKMVEQFKSNNIAFMIVHNKTDITPLNDSLKKHLEDKYHVPVIAFSATNDDVQRDLLINSIQNIVPETTYTTTSLIGDLVTKNDVVLLVVPQDSEAPEGRLILPQVQTIRDGLDNDCIMVMAKVNEAKEYLEKMMPKPVLVITDSQAFHLVKTFVPPTMPLTSFSVILARQKGTFNDYLKGTSEISKLQDGDRVLILESCTHHVSCEDIGRVKIPNLMKKFTGKQLTFEVVSGLSNLPRPITDYKLVVQCGGCVITRRQIFNRLKPAIDSHIPVTNYGMAIAYMQGIFERATNMFFEK